MKQKDLEIGKFLYQYTSAHILEYKIIGTHCLLIENHQEQFYILECQNCEGHENCKIAVKVDDNGKIKYSHMINNFEYDENRDDYFKEHSHFRNGQYYWHNDKNQIWFTSKKEARLWRLGEDKIHYEEFIKNLEKQIENTKINLFEVVDKITSLTEE